MGPYGPHMGPYGPIWALMGPKGPCMNRPSVDLPCSSTRMARFTGQAQQRNAHFQHFSGMAQAFQVACAYASQAICIPATKGRQGLGAISSRCRDSRQTMLLRLGRGPPSAATTVALPGARTKGLLTFSSFLSLGERLGFPVIHRGCCVSPTGLDPSNSFGFELPTSGLTCFSAFCNKSSPTPPLKGEGRC